MPFFDDNIPSEFPQYRVESAPWIFNTIADLRTVRWTGHRMLGFVTGSGDVDDGEGLWFSFDRESTETDDGLDTIKPNDAGASDQGRWKRVNPGRSQAINVKWFGAKGDGSTDDTSAIQSAVDVTPSGGILEFPSGDYVTSSKISVGSDITIRGQGRRQTVIKPNGAFKAIEVVQTSTASTTLANEAVQVNQASFPVADASGISVGDLVTLESDALWYYDNRSSLYKGEVHKVQRIANTTDIFGTYQVQDAYESSETVTVNVYDPREVHLEGFGIDYGSSAATIGLDLAFCLNSTAKDLWINYARNTGLNIGPSVNTVVDGIVVENSNASSTGYGIQVNKAHDVIIRDSTFVNCRRGVDFSGGTPSRNARVVNCYVSANGLEHDGSTMYPDSSGFGTHGPAENILFQGNMVDTVNIAFLLRGGSMVVKDNFIRGDIGTCIVIRDGVDQVISGNHYQSSLNSRPDIGSPNNRNLQADRFIDFDSSDGPANLIVENNVVRYVQDSFLSFRSDLGDNELEFLTLRNNRISFWPNAGGNVYLIDDNGDAIDIVDAHITGNQIHPRGGTEVLYDSNITFGTDVHRPYEELFKTATIDFGSIADGAQAEKTVSIEGAQQGDIVVLGLPDSIESGLTFDAYVSATWTVTIRASNIADGGGAIDPASQDFAIIVRKYINN